MINIKIINMSDLNLKTHDINIKNIYGKCNQCGLLFGMVSTTYVRFLNGDQIIEAETFFADHDVSCDEMLIKNIIE